MKVLVVGAGVSGRAAVRLGLRLGHEMVVYDRDASAVKSVAGSVRAVFGDWDRDLTTGMDLAVVSPGIPPHAVPVRDCLGAGLPVWSELEFAGRHIDLPIVAVTGTNGKTTTTLLITDMLNRSGLKAAAVGNIGVALSDVADEPWDVLVVEASSFQLRFIVRFRAGIAVVLNAAEDHLDWHGSVAAYREAKARIVERQHPDDLCIYNKEDEGARAIAARAPGRTRGFTVEGTEGLVREGLFLPGPVALPVSDLLLSDPAYLVDLAAAALAAEEAGAGREGIEAALRAFEPGEHRRAVVLERGGVTWIDDSKATNPHAAVASIEAYQSVILLAGGRNKGLDLTPMVRHPHLKAVVAFGEAQEELLEAAVVAAHAAASVPEAVGIASSLAGRGDTVLLAPGCASFDMFDSYAARGRAFEVAVREGQAR